MPPEKSTFERILYDLKSRGEATAQDVASRFDLTLMGAHKSLQCLVDSKLVQFEDISQGRGRPRRMFKLTAKGHARFPDRHADITVDMIHHVKELFGQEGLEKLISKRESAQVDRYGGPLSGTLHARAERLAEARSAEGYMARIEPGSAPDEVLLVEDHCPICAAASTCQSFCRSELEVFSAVLGKDVDIERQEHLLSGGRRCTYRLRQTQS